MAVSRSIISVLLVLFQVVEANAETCECTNCACSSILQLTVLGINLWMLIGFIILIIFIIAFTLFYFLLERNKRELVVSRRNVLLNVGKPSKFEDIRIQFREMKFRLFKKIALFSSNYPFFVITLGVIIVAFLSHWLKEMTILTDPVDLWTPTNSEALKQKQYFESNFGPVPRETKVIISYHREPSSHPENGDLSSYVLSKNVLKKVLTLQNKISGIKIWDDANSDYVTLGDVCDTPLGPENKDCDVRSVLNYWQNQQERLDKETTDETGKRVDYRDHLQACLSNPSLWNDNTSLQLPCVGPLGQVVKPESVIGGYKGSHIEEATAIFITIPLNEYISDNDPRLRKAMMWEKAFLKFMTNYSIGDELNISYSAKRSLQDEVSLVNKKSTTLTILVAYTATLLYMVLALGEDHSSKLITLPTSIVISLTGILLILASVISAFGLAVSCDYVISPIAIQIVPFLALSVGGSNIFIIMQRYQKFFPIRTSDFDHKDHLSNALGLTAPALTAATFSEALAFYLASIITETPAIKTFAICAAISVMLNFLFQITVLISVIELSYRYHDQLCKLLHCLAKKLDDAMTDEEPAEKESGKLYQVMFKYYVPIITSPATRYLVVLGCAIFTYISLTLITQLEVGLDGRNTVPETSYLHQYLDDVDEYSKLGTPVYFVVKSGYNYSTVEGQDKICSEHECQLNSLTAQIKNATFNSDSTKIAQSATSWLDDYLTWTDAKGQDMSNFLKQFLAEPPTAECPTGGKLLADSVQINRAGSIGATYFATYQTTLVTSKDYLMAYDKANQLAGNIEEVLNENIQSALKTYEVFAYSNFHVFYAQFQNVVIVTMKSLAVTLIVMFLVKGILLGLSLLVAPLITAALALFTINLLGLLSLLGIAFSDVVLVNVIISVGVAGEIFTHIADSYSSYAGNEETTKSKQIRDTVSNTGSSLLAGSLIPKLLTFCSLALLKSQLVQTYFFQIYLGLLGLAVVYSLLFVPVLLSFVGPLLQPTPTEIRLLALTNYSGTTGASDTSEITPLQPSAGQSAPSAPSASNQ
ncbi:NPC intracellular cholesterol transporter 1-like isoform X2 [Apostichopus japonicus]|uniref:NPC intracellular cholesterol transporter 1-like isoform X2 n=1 Tax=Stichopus japonicus TaxID=307972 RepID=UPI003AB3979D